MEEQTKFIIVTIAIMFVAGVLHILGVSLREITFIAVGAYLGTYAVLMLF